MTFYIFDDSDKYLIHIFYKSNLCHLDISESNKEGVLLSAVTVER